MEVILLESIRNLGRLGDTVKVKDGYGRNFLVPYGKAARATKDNVAQFEARRAELEKKAQETLDAAQQRAAGLNELTITMTARASDEGKLFGSIGTREIAEAISEKGTAIDRSEVLLPEGVLRSIGEYPVGVQLHTDVTVTINLEIVAE